METYGWYKEYYVCSKFIGCIENIEPDGGVVGFNGIKSEVLQENVTLTNKKVIKKGTAVQTMVYPLCGTKKA